MGKVRGMPVLLITVAGRKTGVTHTNPVLYLEDDSEYVVTGSGSGSVKEPQWFKNLRRANEAEIQVGSRRLAVDVEVAEGPQREILWQRLLVRAAFFADYQRKVTRQIPMAVLTPKT
jgi:deazaflavin-dependent oxidoreductase (nitroreductase family)